MKKLLLAIFIPLVFVSCQEPIELDLRQTPPRVVIDALVTNVAGYQRVKVTRSVDFYSSGKSPRVTNANVVVTDDGGNAVSFIHNPNNHADSAGIYLPPAGFAGVIGRTYKLRVELDGEVYEAEDKLLPVSGIDSLRYQVNPDQAEDPRDEGRIYEVLLFAREPRDEENSYLFYFFRNDSLTFFNDTDIYFSDDEFLAERIDGVPSPVFYAKDDQARVEMFSLSRRAYIYYYDLFNLLNNDAGGMFGPIPASPRTNLTNNALGFFQVSAISTKEIKIE